MDIDCRALGFDRTHQFGADVRTSLTEEGEAGSMTEPNEHLLVFQGIHKSFGGVHALKGVSFFVRSGEIHGLVGENGAGKSTLVKITGGVYRSDAGDVVFDGRRAVFHSPRDSEVLGIRIVHQEVPICLNLTVAENIFLDPKPPRRGILLDRKVMNRESVRILNLLGIELDPKRLAGLCSPAERQLLLIAKALAEKVKLVILDEATSSLSGAEVETLVSVIRNLKKAGTTFLFVSHRLGEVIAICDRVTVLRNGEYIDTLANDQHDLSLEVITEKIVGKEIQTVTRQADRTVDKSRVVLKVEGLCQEKYGLKGIDFELHEGEVLGLAGLRGAGRTELLQCLFGVAPPDSGKVSVRGKPVKLRSSASAIASGMGLLSESRNEALYPMHSVRSNMASVIIDRLARFLVIRNREYNEVAQRYVQELQIEAPSIHSEVFSLSGGNQQKVLFGRWLSASPSILLLDEPTRGIDVGVKADIRRRILELAATGISIIYVSLDFEELVQVSDRVLLISRRQLVDELLGDDLTVANIVRTVNRYEQAGNCQYSGISAGTASES
jgi:ABC-type sugar transport system ATPase subunit